MIAVESVVLPSIHMTTQHRIFTMSFASVYPLYVAKAEKKGRKKSEVDAVICWLTGYSQRELEGQLKKQTDIETSPDQRVLARALLAEMALFEDVSRSVAQAKGFKLPDYAPIALWLRAELSRFT